MMDQHGYGPIATDTTVSDAIAAHVALADPHTPYQKESEKDQNNGYPGLSAAGRVTYGCLPVKRVEKIFTPTALATVDEITVTFATDCPDGNPSFASAPRLCGEPAYIRDTILDTEMPLRSFVKTISATTIVIRVIYVSAQPASPSSLTMQFAVSGV